MKTKTERADAIATLRGILKPGDKVETTVMHVSRSGMSRVIQCQVIAIREDKEYPLVDGRRDYDAKPVRVKRTPYIRDISYLVASATGNGWDQSNGGVRIGGCGMNMCFALVYELSSALFPDGFGIVGTRPDGRTVRPTSKRGAAQMVRNGVKFRGRNGDASGWDSSGGYALDYR